MSKLTALKKQIAALQAQAERIAKTEASSAIAKIKGIMADFNLTIDHLTAHVGGKPMGKKTKAKTASVAKYADPKTGKTWSGFGRAPGWIAGAKNRDAFLVAKSVSAKAVAEGPVAAKKASGKTVKAVKAAEKVAKPATKRAVATTKKASKAETATASSKTKPAAKKASAKKSVPKSAASKRTLAAAPVEPPAAPAA